MLGVEETEQRVYGYHNNMETILVSPDHGVTWNAADDVTLAEDKLLTWTDAIEVQLDASFDLNQATPSGIYTVNTWGGMISDNCITYLLFDI